jgi:hypothetical protein
MSETSVGFDLVESFNILSELGLENVGCDLEVLSFSVISDSVKEPSGDSVSFWVVDYVGDGIALLFSQFTSSKARVDSKDFANQKSEASAHTLDFIKSKWDSPLTVDVSIENTVNVFEVSIWVFNDQGHVVSNIISILFLIN